MLWHLSEWVTHQLDVHAAQSENDPANPKAAKGIELETRAIASRGLKNHASTYLVFSNLTMSN
jgi:hypothetical protein